MKSEPHAGGKTGWTRCARPPSTGCASASRRTACPCGTSSAVWISRTGRPRPVSSRRSWPVFLPTTPRQTGSGPAAATPARSVLPANVVSPERVPSRQFLAGVLGGSTRGGAWIAPREMYAVALMGGVELDFREAAFGPGVTEVTVFALWGGVDIVVPPGLQVECSGAGILGGFERTPDELADASAASLDPGSPVLRVNGVALMGGVDVSTRLPGERERDAARRRKLARKARRKELRGW